MSSDAIAILVCLWIKVILYQLEDLFQQCPMERAKGDRKDLPQRLLVSFVIVLKLGQCCPIAFPVMLELFSFCTNALATHHS